MGLVGPTMHVAVWQQGCFCKRGWGFARPLVELDTRKVLRAQEVTDNTGPVKQWANAAWEGG